ncbi:MAG: hypothetical protein QW046_01710 [Candidatus Micrarchaeaceae archaeon]
MKLKKRSKEVSEEVIKKYDDYWGQFYSDETLQNPLEKLQNLLEKWLELTETVDKVNKDLKETKEEIVKILDEKKLWNSNGSFTANIGGNLVIYVVKSSKISVNKVLAQKFLHENIDKIPLSYLSIDFHSLKEAAKKSHEAAEILAEAMKNGAVETSKIIVIKVYGKDSSEPELKKEKRD